MNEVDVVVVGGGVSGLAAARRLVSDGLDSVVLLEGRDEPGGKCLQRSASGRLLDCGAGWTAATQYDIKALASAYGIGTYPTDVEGGKLPRLVDGAVEYLEPGDLGLGEAALADVERAVAELGRLSDRVPPSRPWEAEGADELDAMTLESWICSQSADRSAQMALALIFQSTVTSSRQLSLLSALAFVSSCGGVDELATEADELFVGGAASVPRRVAEELGEKLRLGWPVSEISWSRERAEVTGPRGTVIARRVIVAMSPADAARIAFRPGLSTKRELLQKGWLQSSLIKTNVVYERPFWQEPRGDRPAFTGWVTNDEGCPSVVLDATPADRGVGVLATFTFVHGERERFGMSQEVLDDPAARERLLFENLVRIYGPEAESPIAVQETHWGQEPYVSGCLGFAPPGLLTHCGEALQDPVGPLHWAGTESADVWINHLSGAVQAGERAAAEVAAELRVGLQR